MNGSMTAKRLRIFLFGAIFLIIAAIAGGFLFAHRNLAGYANQISQLNADASSGDQNITTLKNLEKRLNEEKDTIQSARSIVADNASFAEQVVNDVTRIAAQSGVSITGLEYVDAGAGVPAAAPVATAPGTTAPTATSAPSGVTLKSISVTVASPVDYTRLLTFIKNIESNNLRLQIATVTLTKDVGNQVGTQAFSIGAYVR